MIRGPMRQCQQGSGRVSTWLPATASFAAGASPMLRGLEDLVARAAAQQEAEEA